MLAPPRTAAPLADLAGGAIRGGDPVDDERRVTGAGRPVSGTCMNAGRAPALTPARVQWPADPWR